MKKTIKQITRNGRTYNMLDLPNTDYFKFETYNLYGSNIERIIMDKLGKNVYGISHFIEHLGFRATKDYSTEDIMILLKNEGTYNASTDYDGIKYWFKTTMDRRELAVKLVCNFGLNDLKNIPQEEFDIEKKVVYNEAKRYADDDQSMFHFNVTRDTANLHVEDNVIGIPETIDAFNLQDAIDIKEIFLMYGPEAFNVTYDSTIASQDEILDMIDEQLERFIPEDTTPILKVTKELYDSYLAIQPKGVYRSDSKAEQLMTCVQLESSEVNEHVLSKVMSYISTYSKGDSLNDLIREKNGLTYGVYFYTSRTQEKLSIKFACDVTRGTEAKLMELFEESIVSVCDNFTPEKLEDYKRTITLKRRMRYMNQENYNNLLEEFVFSPMTIAEYDGRFEENIERALDFLYSMTFERFKRILEDFKKQVVEKDYVIITN